ncbi:MAG TPA: hypothetical protein VLA50_04860 [Erythrobacter sp.]|nr:hypothetical protein [Erythrobacter sp.]
MRNHVIIFSSSLILSACGSAEQEFPTGDPRGTAVPIAPFTPLPIKPPPNFTESENGVYYYIAAVSEEDSKKGKVAGEVHGFKFLGKDKDGKVNIASISDNGDIIYKATCSDPCSIIKYDDGDRVAFNPSSIIGAAFEDALNGHLVPTLKERTSSALADESSSVDDALQWAGRYNGEFEGAVGEVTLSTSADGRVSASLAIGGDRCAGQLSGVGRPKGNLLEIVKPTDDSGNQCKVQIINRSGVLELQEETCGFFHGFECSFNGEVRKR